MGSPRVAVIVPCHNEGRLIAETVGSIQEQEPVELVVVDDASGDPTTRECLADLERGGTRVTRHATNLGLIAARATGLRETTAPYVFPLDGDDLAVAGALTRMADLLDANPEAAVCFGDYNEFGSHSELRAVPERLDPYRVAYTNEYPISALLRRTVLEDVGGWAAKGYDEPAYADWNLWITLAERGALAIHAGPGVLTFSKRCHPGRMLQKARRDHPELYDGIRARHPRLFSELRDHRRRSDLGALRKMLYPHVYGGRRRFAFEPRVKRWLDRLGIWTLRR
jgi:glycosyltransferase involved in cell wall biosynthesis